ncbi:MAG TPA: hypothetical protein VHZ01_13845 [Casimicrobiaceae bacterium]|nr:hypothetical protein [Casimicrobiaceae bacterium]
MRRPAFLVLVALITISAAFIVATASQLPGLVASHFDSRSAANGWMTRGNYLLSMLALAILLPLAIVGFITLVTRTAPRLINLPHRAYWLAEGRREQTLATLLTFACVQGGLLTVFAAALHYVILQAHTTAPPQLPGALFVAVLLGLLAAMVAWTIALFARFRHAG